MLKWWQAIFRNWFTIENLDQGILDTLYQVLASPSQGLGGITKWRPLGWAILTAVFIALVFALSTFPNPSDFTRVVFSLEKGSVSFVTALILWVIIFLAGLIASAGVFHGVARLLRGRGSYLGMLCGLSFATFPVVFFAPLGLLSFFLGLSGTFLYLIGGILLLLWILVLQIIAVRQNYSFSTGRAITAYFIPGGAVLITLVSIAAVHTFL